MFKTVYYYTSWSSRAKNFQVENINEKSNNIVYGNWYINKECKVSSTDSWIDYGDDNINIGGNFKKFKDLKSQKELYIELLFGDFENFNISISNNKLRTDLIINIIEMLQKTKFLSGIVFDFRVISDLFTQNDNINFELFLNKMRKAFNNNGLYEICINLIVTGIPEKCNYNIFNISKIIDRLYVMTSDYHDEYISIHHSNPRKSKYGNYSCEASIDCYLSKGVESEKIYITCVLYSKGYSNTDGLGYPADGISGDLSWEKGKVDYKDLPLKDMVELFDNESKSAYTYDSKKRIFNSYDNVKSVIEKCKIIKEKNLGGIFVNDISSDKDINNPDNILNILASYIY